MVLRNRRCVYNDYMYCRSSWRVNSSRGWGCFHRILPAWLPHCQLQVALRIFGQISTWALKFRAFQTGISKGTGSTRKNAIVTLKKRNNIKNSGGKNCSFQVLVRLKAFLRAIFYLLCYTEEIKKNVKVTKKHQHGVVVTPYPIYYSRYSRLVTVV